MSSSNAYKFFNAKALRKRNLSDREIATFIKDIYTADQAGMDMIFFLIYVYSKNDFSDDPPYEGMKQGQDSAYTWDFEKFPLQLKKMLVVALKHHKKNSRRE